MVKDKQVRRLIQLMKKTGKISAAAAEAGMDENTARKYLRLKTLPSEVKADHTWRTRKDPFDDVWDEVKKRLQLNNGLEAKTLFQFLQRRYPGQFSDGQLRTLQRRIKVWRALEGPAKEVFFSQKYLPGQLCESDFTNMNDLRVRIGGNVFNHMIYHFVLPYSNWETGTICFSESFESLSEGLQNGLWELGGVPRGHRTDRLSTAVQKTGSQKEFTDRYSALLKHYKLKGFKIQAAKPHENGDVEQRHFRFKKALDQQLMLRGSRDFVNRAEYEAFLKKLFVQLNAGRQKRLAEELSVLRRLPLRRLESLKRIGPIKVSSGSTIRVNKNVYSVHSRMIGEYVNVRLYAEYFEVWYAQRCVERIPRIRGEKKHYIQYRHIIDWLIRKPGAFENYRYRKDLFPTTRFRMAYDTLKKQHSNQKAVKEYLRILNIAAKVSETLVDDALCSLFDLGGPVSFQEVEYLVDNWREHSGSKIQLEIAGVDLCDYDGLLDTQEAAG